MWEEKTEELAEEAPESVSSAWARKLFVMGIVIVGVLTWKQFHHPSSLQAGGWGSDWDQAVAQSRATGKPALVLFTADWCPACKQFESETLSRSDVRAELERNFTLVTVDLTEQSGPNARRVQAFGVQGIPTLIRYGASGKEVARTNGMGAESLMRWLGSR
jgi:thiol:disulfide interchange protein DsbD